MYKYNIILEALNKIYTNITFDYEKDIKRDIIASMYIENIRSTN